MANTFRLAVVLSLGLVAFPARAQPDASAGGSSPAKEAVEEVDEVEDVEVVDVAPAASTGQPAAPRGGWKDVAGRFHPAIVHLPIGWLLMAMLLDVLAFGLRRRELEAAGTWVLGGAVLAFLPGILTGLLRKGFVSQEPAVQRLVGTHEPLILVTAGVAATAMGVRLLSGRRFAGGWKATYLLLMIAAVALVTVAGHWGGKAAWGPDYLPF